MSWQATAYVKELTHVTVYEKLLLFVLADYHNTHRRAAWPSVASLAEEALMTERNCFKLLAALELPRDGHPHGLIRKRRTGQGRGSITEYQFVELDRKDESDSPFKTGKDERNPERKDERKDETCDSAIRKERWNDGTKEPSENCLTCNGTGLWIHRGHLGRTVYCDCPAGLALSKRERSAAVL